jgi:hypothetical protein
MERVDKITVVTDAHVVIRGVPTEYAGWAMAGPNTAQYIIHVFIKKKRKPTC